MESSLKVPFLDLRTQYKGIQSEIDKAISNVLEEGVFVGGSRVTAFEEEFGDFIGVTNCVGVANGTDALEIAIEALALPAGSEILVPANSYISSSEAVSRTGHLPVFVDVDPTTYLIDFDSISNRTFKRARAMVVVHLFGQMVDPVEIKRVSDKYGMKVIEDCAQAHGARFHNQAAGSVGDVACFSFYPGKTLGAYGDAGMIATGDAAIARKCRMISNHGREEKYNHVFEGRNSRLDPLQAAILSVKLPHLLRWRDTRQVIANTYDELLEPIPGVLVPVRDETSVHAWHLYVVRCQERDSLQKHLTKAGIETGIHYPISLPMLPAYQYLQSKQLTNNANNLAAEILSLPIGDHMTVRDAQYVCESIKAFFE